MENETLTIGGTYYHWWPFLIAPKKMAICSLFEILETSDEIRYATSDIGKF